MTAIPRPCGVPAEANFGPSGTVLERLEVRQSTCRRQSQQSTRRGCPGNSLDARAGKVEAEPESLRQERLGDHFVSCPA